MKSKESEHEFECNELSIQTRRPSIGVSDNNPNGLQTQGSLQRKLAVEFRSQTSVTDELIDFRTKMVPLKSCPMV